MLGGAEIVQGLRGFNIQQRATAALAGHVVTSDDAGQAHVTGLTQAALAMARVGGQLRADGAEIICVPSNFTVPTGQAHWEVMLRARAIEQYLQTLDLPIAVSLPFRLRTCISFVIAFARCNEKQMRLRRRFFPSSFPSITLMRGATGRKFP